MTEEYINDDNLPVEDELEALKAKATLMGIKFHPASGVKSLKEKIDAQVKSADKEEVPSVKAVAAKAETENEMKLRVKKEATRLIRCRVACMNPNKAQWEGEIFCVGNAIIPTIKKMVPFNQDFHIPNIMMDVIKDKKCQIFVTQVDPVTRKKSTVGKLIPEFAVEVLPSLTSKELKDLAQRQAMSEGTGTAA